MRLVVIDPRRTPTCDIADLHLPLRSGTDAMLFNGLLSWLANRAARGSGLPRSGTPGARRRHCWPRTTPPAMSMRWRATVGVQPGALRQFYEWFGGTERVITAFFQGVNQSSAGTDKANSIINAHLLTGRIGRPGMGPFSITGQPNAMGGREVGGLANMLAAHMELDNPEHRAIGAGFWQSPRMAERPGLKAVDLFEAIHRGKIKAVWIMATNPARQPAECRSRPRSPARAASSSWCPTASTGPTLRRWPTCCCRRPPGARRTAR